MTTPHVPVNRAPDCAYCDWCNIYNSCTDGSRECERYEHWRTEHPELPEPRR